MPVLSDEEITDLIAKGKLGAICIDTSIANRTAYDLESGSLAALGQFAQGPVAVLIPDTIAGEIKKHMLTNAQGAVQSMRGALRELRKSRRPSADNLAAAEAGLGLAGDLEAEIEQRWSGFVEKTSAQILKAGDYLEGDLLVEKYFQSLPPFASTGYKKLEFPDAIALLELESWGKKNSKYVLAISTDNDWSDFSGISEWVISKKELTPSLGLFHKEDKYVADRALSMLYDTESFCLASEIKDELINFIDNFIPEIEAYSYLFYEEEFIQAEFLEFLKIHESSLIIIDSNENSVTLSFPIIIKARITANFAFAVHDSIDRDYVPMGSTEATRNVDVSVNVVLQVEREIGPDECARSLTVDAPRFVPVDFGEVAPDWEDYEE